MEQKNYLQLAQHYESCFGVHGDTPKGVDWPNGEDAEKRYAVMSEIFLPRLATQPVSVLDFGCGLSHFYEFLSRRGLSSNVAYTGMDISPVFCEASRKKFPANTYHCVDILHDNLPGQFDYVVANGVFTEKLKMTQAEMMAFLEAMLPRLFQMCRYGLAFNVMTKLVDWERDDLFHVSFDALAALLTRKLSRRFVIRHDYRLWEYTVYVYPLEAP